MASEIDKAEARDRRLRPFGNARRSGGLGVLHPTVMEHFPNTLRGHGSMRTSSCNEMTCMKARGKAAHADRGKNVDEWLDLVGA